MSTLSDIDVRTTVSDSVLETISSMLSMEISPIEGEPPLGQGILRMVGSLNFTGKVTGILNTQVAVDFGRRMASALLGMAPEEVDPGTEIRDLVAEITHIIGGNLKSVLNDSGYPCVLSAPRITYGTDFSIKSLNMDRFDRYAFQQDEHALIIEVGLKAQEGDDARIDFCSPDGAGRLPHVDLQKLELLDCNRRLTEAAVDGFDTMFSLKLERMEPASAAGLQGMRYTSSVGFAGDAAGIVSLHVGQELSRVMAANMLGVEPAQIEGTSEIEDMLDKLGTIVGGDLISALTGTGLRCALSTPSLTIGSDFKIESLHLERFERLVFRHGSHSVFLEMGLKIAERAKSAPAPVRETPPPAETSRAAARRRASDPAAPAQPEPSATPDTRPAPEDFELDLLLDIPVELTVELGRTKMPIHELLKLRPGSAVKLARLEGEPVDILANDVLIARGVVVVRHEKYGIRITEITSRMERLRGLK